MRTSRGEPFLHAHFLTTTSQPQHTTMNAHNRQRCHPEAPKNLSGTQAQWNFPTGRRSLPAGTALHGDPHPAWQSAPRSDGLIGPQYHL